MLCGKSGRAKNPYKAIGIEMIPEPGQREARIFFYMNPPSITNSHRQPDKPAVPFIPVYNPAWRYPLNMPAIAAVCSNKAMRLASWDFPYQLPKMLAKPGKEHDSRSPMKNLRA